MNLWETGYLKLEVKRMTEIKFGMNNGGSYRQLTIRG